MTVLLPRSKWRLHDLPDVNARIKAEGRIRDNFREYAEQELALGHGHTVDAWNLARLADAVLVCLDTIRVVWGPCPRRPPAKEDVDAAEDVLRQLWRDKVAVPAYNYPSYHGHLTYVPWTEWRAERRPTLDADCFHDHAALMERIWSAKGGDDDEEEEAEE